MESVISNYLKSERSNMFILVQAGTYIKEFVHGDLGRTHPRYDIRYFQFMGSYKCIPSFDTALNTLFIMVFAALDQFWDAGLKFCNLMSQTSKWNVS